MKLPFNLNSRKSIDKIESITRTLEKYFSRGLKDKDLHLRIFAVLPLILCVALTLYAFGGLNSQIPLWYTKTWGEQVLTGKANIFIVPVIATFLTASTFALAYFCKKFYFTYLSQILLYSAIVFNTGFLISVARIIYVSSQTQLAVLRFSPQTQSLAFLLVAGFLLSYLIIPKFTAWAFKKNLVTDPSVHKHPGMILVKASARGGGFVFSLLLAVASLVFLEKTLTTTGIAISIFLCGLVGLLDDLQNSRLSSKLQFIENPFVRLFIFLPIPVIVMMAFGVVSGYINNPFDGYIQLTNFSFNVAGRLITPLPYLFTLIWTLAIMNMVSWSNGVDGQFGGVAGISILIIGILALRLVDAEPEQLNIAKLAFLGAGIAFGFIPRTWHPSKIMWGFGAVSVGLLLSSLSIVSRAKVATAIMVIMIPFLDGVITFFRRLLQKKNPLKGDRGHLHHLLLERGWSPQKVAIFYWVATAFFGVIGILSADKSSALVTLTLGGIVALVIIALNINKSRTRKDTEPLQPLV
jgi:UDP-GlcNAc:undecaprenyl-phosphate/decaprenyl-phosphate GlcNAc-1-phosphate transferase